MGLLVVLLGFTVDTAAASPYIRKEKNVVGSDRNDASTVITSYLPVAADVAHPHDEDPARDISSLRGPAATLDGRHGGKTFVAIDSSHGGHRRLDNNSPGVAVYIAVLVVAVVLFLVSLRACGVGVACIPIFCC